MYLWKCHKALNCICLMLRTKKFKFISSLNKEHFYKIDEVDSDEIEEFEMANFKRRQIKHAMRESRRFF